MSEDSLADGFLVGYYNDFQIQTASDGVVSFAEALYKNNMHSETTSLFSISSNISTSGGRYRSTSDFADKTVDIPLYLYDSNGVITDVLNVIIVNISASAGANSDYGGPGYSASASYTMTTDTGTALCSSSSSATYNLFGMNGLIGASYITLNAKGATYASVGDWHDQYDISSWASSAMSYTLQYIKIETE